VVQRARQPAAPRLELRADAKACRSCHLTEHASWHLSGHTAVECAACHGPGAEHVRVQSASARRYGTRISGAPDTTIGNPARLEPSDATGLCAGCHALEAGGVRASACHVGERITCGLCHAMHLSANDRRAPDAWIDGQLAPLMAGDAACLQCHADSSPHQAGPSSTARCYDCHMRSTGPRSHTVQVGAVAGATNERPASPEGGTGRRITTP
jgi:hypothetical protein